MSGKRAPKYQRQEIEDGVYDYESKSLNDRHLTVGNIKVNLKCKTEGQKELVKAIRENDLIICSGPAGCGKTHIAVAEALRELNLNKKYKKIVLIKSVKQLKGEEVGLLKGDLKEKMEPVIKSFKNKFTKILKSENHYQNLVAQGFVEYEPIALLRGLDFDESIIIVDEVQNVSYDNIKAVMTRLGENSKMILLGDEDQIDRSRKGDSSLPIMMKLFSDSKHIGCVELTTEDVVRNPLVREIIEKLRNYEQQEKNRSLLKQTRKDVSDEYESGGRRNNEIVESPHTTEHPDSSVV